MRIEALLLRFAGCTAARAVSPTGFYGPGPFFGPFGPGQFCGTLHQPIFKRVGNRRTVVGTRKVHRCFVPAYADTTLTLTYAAS